MNVKTIARLKQKYSSDPATSACYQELTLAFTEFLTQIYAKLEATTPKEGIK